MKKLFVTTFMFLMFATMQAQIVQSRSSGYTKYNHPTKNYIAVDLGAGSMTGDHEDTEFGLDLGVRWTMMLNDNLGWDVLKLSAQSDTGNFDRYFSVQLKTGVRGVTPVVLGNCSIYGNFALGYGYYTNCKKGDLAYEFGAGVNITPKVSLGVAYNICNFTDIYSDWDEEDIKVGLFSVRLSYRF